MHDGIEKHLYQGEGFKQPSNIKLGLTYFGNLEYKHISGVILNNNAISEEIEKQYFRLLLNPLAINPIDTSMLQHIEYFSWINIDEKNINYGWKNR